MLSTTTLVYHCPQCPQKLMTTPVDSHVALIQSVHQKLLTCKTKFRAVSFVNDKRPYTAIPCPTLATTIIRWNTRSTSHAMHNRHGKPMTQIVHDRKTRSRAILRGAANYKSKNDACKEGSQNKATPHLTNFDPHHMHKEADMKIRTTNERNVSTVARKAPM